jgi:hypothetical protein
VEVRTDDAYVPGTHRWLASPRVELRPAESVPLVVGPGTLSAEALDAVIARARSTPPADDYLVWSRYPFVTVEADGGAWRVRFTDARYDDQVTASSLAGVEVRVDR